MMEVVSHVKLTALHVSIGKVAQNVFNNRIYCKMGNVSVTV